MDIFDSSHIIANIAMQPLLTVQIKGCMRDAIMKDTKGNSNKIVYFSYFRSCQIQNIMKKFSKDLES